MTDEDDGPDAATSIDSMRNYRALLPALRGITERQHEILQWLCEGKSCSEIAMILGISPRTVENHLRVIYDLLGVDNALGVLAALYHANEARFIRLFDAMAAPPRMPIYRP
jgi:DNA-binding CsgD family transcriptional regulator